MTIEHAMEYLQPVLSIFTQAWRAAWDDMLNRYNDPDWDKRCRSTVLQMQAVIHAKRLCHGMPEVICLPFEQRSLFQYREVAIIQLKQLDEQMRARNYQTQTAKSFASQDELRGLSALPRLTIGLVPDAHWLSIAGIYVTFPHSISGNNWVLDISGDPVDVNTTEFAFDEPGVAQTNRWQPKRTSTGDSANGI